MKFLMNRMTYKPLQYNAELSLSIRSTTPARLDSGAVRGVGGASPAEASAGQPPCSVSRPRWWGALRRPTCSALRRYAARVNPALAGSYALVDFPKQTDATTSTAALREA